jgi:hypothetical protein
MYKEPFALPNGGQHGTSKVDYESEEGGAEEGAGEEGSGQGRREQAGREESGSGEESGSCGEETGSSQEGGSGEEACRQEGPGEEVIAGLPSEALGRHKIRAGSYRSAVTGAEYLYRAAVTCRPIFVSAVTLVAARLSPPRVSIRRTAVDVDIPAARRSEDPRRL